MEIIAMYTLPFPRPQSARVALCIVTNQYSLSWNSFVTE